MTQPDLDGPLRAAVDEVLETMFFVQGEGEAHPGRGPEELFTAQVEFEGSPPGTLGLRITREAARRMAADFLGEETWDLPESRTLDVVLEMANMFCGAVLSRVESETVFRLAPPTVTFAVGEVVEPSEGASIYDVQLSEGALQVALRTAGAGS